MVNKPIHPSEINDYTKPFFLIAKGSARDTGRRDTKIAFPEALFNQIRDEAIKRGWSFARMVRHLCEASIEGIP